MGCVLFMKFYRRGTLRLSSSRHSNASATSPHPTRDSMQVTNASYENTSTVVTSAASQPASDSNYSTLFQTSLSEQQEASTRMGAANCLFELNAPVHTDLLPVREVDASYEHVTQSCVYDTP